MIQHPTFPVSPAWRGHRGVASLEFVLVFPAFLILLLGIIDVSLILCDQAVITNASREAARAGVVVRVPPLTATQISAVAVNAAQGNLVSGTSVATPTVTIVQPNGTTSGSPLQVTVTWPYQGLMLGTAISSLTGPLTLSATTVMNYE